jgi:hypothetical protein
VFLSRNDIGGSGVRGGQVSNNLRTGGRTRVSRGTGFGSTQLHVLRKAHSLWLAACRDGQRQTTAEGLRLHRIPRARLMPQAHKQGVE